MKIKFSTIRKQKYPEKMLSDRIFRTIYISDMCHRPLWSVKVWVQICPESPKHCPSKQSHGNISSSTSASCSKNTANVLSLTCLNYRITPGMQWYWLISIFRLWQHWGQLPVCTHHWSTVHPSAKIRWFFFCYYLTTALLSAYKTKCLLRRRSSLKDTCHDGGDLSFHSY